MNAKLEQNVEILSDHYVQRFKFLLEGEMLNLQVKRQKMIISILFIKNTYVMMANVEEITINGYM